ncbi:MAG: fumarate hydratase [Chloroflexi bacterium]|nr:fumarate hydratase [Chloroflexota bacterium]
MLDTVFLAQGERCASGLLGLALGGDRGSGYLFAKQQLLRPLDDENPIAVLADLEQRL